MKFELFDPDAKLPTQYLGGLNLYAIDDFEIPACELRVLDLGLSCDIPRSWVAVVKDRFSLASRGIVTTGQVFHHGEPFIEWKIILRNTRIGGAFRGSRGDPIAQVVVVPYYPNPPQERTFS